MLLKILRIDSENYKICSILKYNVKELKKYNIEEIKKERTIKLTNNNIKKTSLVNIMHSELFTEQLLKNGYNFFTGVPCSFFKGTINEIMKNPEINYIPAANEGAAISLASGAFMTGRMPVVIMQNSGFGNSINPLTSLSIIYNHPMLLLISARGYKVKDEPQHVVMGEKLTEMLKSIELEYEEINESHGDDEIINKLKNITLFSIENKKPVALVIMKDALKSYQSILSESMYEMSRFNALEKVLQYVGDKDAVIASTGKIAREAFVIRDLANIFYMQGSMGHAMNIGLGVALTKPNKRVFVLEGDGSMIMHMGSLSTIGFTKINNFIHIILDNEVYGSTGSQKTTSTSVDFKSLAISCGYKRAFSAKKESELIKILERIKEFEDGPTLIHIKINNLELDNLPRISSKYTVEEITSNFINKLNED